MGEPVSANPADSRATRRVKESVKNYQLDSAQLCEARQAKWRLCSEKLKSLQQLVHAKRHQITTEGSDFSSALIDDIAALFDDKAEFTSVAKACAKNIPGSDDLILLARSIAQRRSQSGGPLKSRKGSSRSNSATRRA
jgi:hypothetical protein